MSSDGHSCPFECGGECAAARAVGSFGRTAAEISALACGTCGVTDKPVDLDVSTTPPEYVCRKCVKKPRCGGCERRANRLTIPAGGLRADARCGECNRRSARDAKIAGDASTRFADVVLALLHEDFERLDINVALLRIPGVLDALVTHYGVRARARLAKETT